MSQHPPQATENHRLVGLEAEPRPLFFLYHHAPRFHADAPSAAAAGFLTDLGIGDLSSVRKAKTPPDHRSQFGGGVLTDRLLQFYCDNDSPWNIEKSRVRGHPEALPSSFTGFRETAVPSECATSIGPGTLQSDSGYGSQARQSVGIPSVYGDADRGSESLLNQLSDTQIYHGTSHGNFQTSWTQGALGAPNVVPTNNLPRHSCRYCPRTFSSQADYKKHIARHEKPYRCPEPECSKATKAFGTSNDLERHLKSVHRKSGTRYRCHHGACLEKAKDWPRADNFRSHLKKIHNICLHAEDSLDEYIYRPANPEILSNVGVAPELIPPPMHGSPAPPSWSQLEQDAGVPVSGTGTNVELSLNCNDMLAHPHANDPNPARIDSVFFDACPRQDAQNGSHESGYQDMSGGSLGFVRPNDLNTRNSSAMDPAPSSGEPEGDAIVLGDDENCGINDGVGTPERIGNHDGDYQANGLRAPVIPFEPLQGCGEHGFFFPQDTLHQHKKSDETSPRSRTVSATDGSVRSGTPLPSDPASTTGSSENRAETDPEGAEATFQVLMGKLEQSQLEKLLLSHGYVKPKAAQTKPRKAAQSSSHLAPVTCTEPTCRKTFNRNCELKKHVKRHEKPYGCTQCPKRFGSKNDWKRHENSQHFQHEIWKCDERLKPPLSGSVCDKVCHRRETFRAHLTSQHGISDPLRLDHKLDKCRIGRLGEARFWCGFCRDVVELPPEVESAQGVFNARYDHIDDHYSGRNGAVKRDASEWLFGDSETADGDARVLSRVEERTDGEAAGLPQGEGSRKRSRYAAGLPSPKRTKTGPPSENIMWYCCQCNNAWNVSNVPSCLVCPAHVRCNDCMLEEVEGKDEDQVTMG